MKILALTSKSPYPLVEGRALRTFNLLKQAARRHEIHLLSFVQTPEEVEGIEAMRDICASVAFEPLYLDGGRTELLRDAALELASAAPLMAVKYSTSRMRRRLRASLEAGHFDVLHLDMLHLGQYLDEAGPVPVVLVDHNVESVLLERRAQNERRLLAHAYLRYQVAKLRRFEARSCERADAVVAVSEHDAAQLRALAPRASVRSVPNGVDTDFFCARDVPRQAGGMVFVGGLGWFPNLDAMRYFCESILPLIRRECPEASLTVVGKNPDERAAKSIAAHPCVCLTGMIDDIRDTVSAAAVYVVPLRIGGGTRLKILDALSMGKAIVTTSLGCEGLDVVHGEHVLIADEPQRFAREVLRVLANPALAAELGRRGRELVRQRYEWAVIAEAMEEVYAACRQGRSGRSREGGADQS